MPFMDLFAYYELWIQYFINAGMSHDFLINILQGIMNIKVAEDATIVAQSFYV